MNDETYTREEVDDIALCFECAVGLITAAHTGDIAMLGKLGRQYNETKAGMSDKARAYVEARESSDEQPDIYS